MQRSLRLYLWTHRVGPGEGVIEEVLRETGNPTYEPGSVEALAEALETVRDADVQRGQRNKTYAIQKISREKVKVG